MANTEIRYIDDIILCEVINFANYGDPIIVFCNSEGATKTLDPTAWHFAPTDVIDAYKELVPSNYFEAEDEQEEIHRRVEAFKKWMIDTGCPAEELEDEE